MLIWEIRTEKAMEALALKFEVEADEDFCSLVFKNVQRVFD